MGCPDDRCGFTLNPAKLFKDWDGNVEQFYENREVATCYRDAWRDGRCVWHAEVEEKPLEDLRTARADRPERLDGAYLVGVEAGDALSFGACTLIFADFTDADLRSADFTDADLRDTEFTNSYLGDTDFGDANLSSAAFTDADLREANVSDSHLAYVDFANAYLHSAEFTNASLRHADFADANLYNADFTDVQIDSTEFTDANLEYAKFTNANLRGVDFSNLILRNADFADANFTKAKFINAVLENANLAEAHLPVADFTGAGLTRAEFANANLRSADFSNASLRHADFTDADLVHADFTNASRRHADFADGNLRQADFTNADLPNADFADANLYNADFINASLRHADFTDADLEYADLTHVTLHDVLLVRADCRGTTFTSSLLYGTVFADTRINSKTTFYDPGATYYDSITSRPACVYEENPLTVEDLLDDTHPLEAAEWVYRRLEKLHDENALSEEAREFHISKEEARRAYQRELGEYARYFVSTLQWHLSRHGESIRQIFISAAVLIVACGVLYPFVGGFESDSSGTSYRFWELTFGSLDGVPLPYVSLLVDGPLDFAGMLLQSLYFSVITFTTIGYGDLYPTGAGSKFLVGLESLSGAILIALFVFVLGRRVAR